MALIFASKLKSGNASLPLGTLVPINSKEQKIVTTNDTWLRTGLLEDDLATYPDAPRITRGVTETLEAITGTGETLSFAWTPSTIWALNSNPLAAFEFTHDGVATGRSLAAPSDSISITVSDGKLWFHRGATGQLSRYDLSTLNLIGSSPVALGVAIITLDTGIGVVASNGVIKAYNNSGVADTANDTFVVGVPTIVSASTGATGLILVDANGYHRVEGKLVVESQALSVAPKNVVAVSSNVLWATLAATRDRTVVTPTEYVGDPEYSETYGVPNYMRIN